MKTLSNNLENMFITIHNDKWIERQRYAGRVLSSIMLQLENVVLRKEAPSLLEMDRFVEEEIIKNGCSPTFKGYKGYPNSLITSVNKQLVHAIPSEYKLQEGDLITFDFGVSFEGAITDSASTFVFGQYKDPIHQKMVDVGRECLYNAIRSIRKGKRLNSIGESIDKTATKNGLNVIRSFGGHGLDYDQPHAFPFVANFGSSNTGPRFQAGMSLAIEPLLVPGDCSIDIIRGKDGWAINTEDYSTHFEHTIFIHNDRVEIMTHREGEKINREVPF